MSSKYTAHCTAGAASCPPSPFGANQEKRVEIEAVTDLRNDGAFSSHLELRRYLTATAFIKTGVFSASTALRHCGTGSITRSYRRQWMDPASDETTLRHQVRRPTSDVQRPECLRLYEGLQQHSRWNSVALTKHEVTCGQELVQLLRHTDAPLTLAPCYSDGCNLRKTATDMGHHETP